MHNLKVSIITVSFNSAETIADTIISVASQSYANIEHIIIDGASTDGTVDIIRSLNYSVSTLVSEPDSGIYNAMNKGIMKATGDIVGFLNSDDVFSNNKIIETVIDAFSNSDINSVYGDIRFVNPKNTTKVVRYYSSRHFRTGDFKYGFMPAHPSFYARKSLYDFLGYYKENYTIAADFELLLRFFSYESINPKYIPLPFVTMRTGGISNSSVKNRHIINKEIIRACGENGISTSYLKIYLRYFRKILEYFRQE